MTLKFKNKNHITREIFDPYLLNLCTAHTVLLTPLPLRMSKLMRFDLQIYETIERFRLKSIYFLAWSRCTPYEGAWSRKSHRVFLQPNALCLSCNNCDKLNSSVLRSSYSGCHLRLLSTYRC